MSKKNRVYNLAKEIKVEVNKLLIEIQKEDKSVKVPSQKISDQLADEFRKRYFVRLIANEGSQETSENQIAKNKKDKNELRIAEQKEVQLNPKVSSNIEINEDLLDIELNALDKCNNMSADQLYEYLLSCLTKSTKTTKFPNSKETYYELVKLLQRKMSERVSKLATKELRLKINNEYLSKVNILTARIKLKFNKSTNLHSQSNNSNYLSFKDEQIIGNEIANFNSKMTINHLPWKILSAGEKISENIVKHFKKLLTKKRWQNKKFDEQRILKVESYLNPACCYIGEQKFEGYVVYCFNWTNKVILESPFYGNAVYVIKGDWIQITQVSKWTARNKYSNQVTVIRHSSSWLDNLRRTLKTS